jgi:UDP-glucose 4-epimerase
LFNGLTLQDGCIALRPLNPTLDLAQVVISELGSASTIDRVPYEAAYQSGFQDMPRRRPDLRKLERLTGFRPRAGVRDVVRQVAGLGPVA